MSSTRIVKSSQVKFMYEFNSNQIALSVHCVPWLKNEKGKCFCGVDDGCQKPQIRSCMLSSFYATPSEVLVDKGDTGCFREKLDRSPKWASVLAKLEDEEDQGFVRMQENTIYAPLNGATHWSEGENPPVKVVADGTDTFLEEEPDVSSERIQEPWELSNDDDVDDKIRRIVDGHPLAIYVPRFG
jgi:hypothetical protein